MAKLVDKIRDVVPNHRIRVQIFDVENGYSRTLTIKDASFIDVYTNLLKALRDMEEL